MLAPASSRQEAKIGPAQPILVKLLNPTGKEIFKASLRKRLLTQERQSDWHWAPCVTGNLQRRRKSIFEQLGPLPELMCWHLTT